MTFWRRIVSIGTAVRGGLGENGSFSFSGRSTRSECWQFGLGAVLVFGALAALLEVLPDDDAHATFPSVLMPILLVAELGLFLAAVAMLVRRLHDTGRTGWWLLLMLVLGPIGAVLLVVFVTRPSGPDNEFGPAPTAELQPALG